MVKVFHAPGRPEQVKLAVEEGVALEDLEKVAGDDSRLLEELRRRYPAGRVRLWAVGQPAAWREVEEGDYLWFYVAEPEGRFKLCAKALFRYPFDEGDSGQAQVAERVAEAVFGRQGKGAQGRIAEALGRRRGRPLLVFLDAPANVEGLGLDAHRLMGEFGLFRLPAGFYNVATLDPVHKGLAERFLELSQRHCRAEAPRQAQQPPPEAGGGPADTLAALARRLGYGVAGELEGLQFAAVFLRGDRPHAVWEVHGKGATAVELAKLLDIYRLYGERGPHLFLVVEEPDEELERWLSRPAFRELKPRLTLVSPEGLKRLHEALSRLDLEGEVRELLRRLL